MDASPKSIGRKQLPKKKRKEKKRNKKQETAKQSVVTQTFLPPPCGLFVAEQFMNPFELWTSSFRFRDESQFQPWGEDNRVHRVSSLFALLHF